MFRRRFSKKNKKHDFDRFFTGFQAKIIDQEKELVFLAMTVPDYEVMAYNMQELKRYITELKEVVVYYRKVTMPPSDGKKASK